MPYAGVLLQEGVIIDKGQDLNRKKGYLLFAPGKIDEKTKRDVVSVKGTFRATTHHLPIVNPNERPFFGLYLFYDNNRTALQDWDVFCFGPEGSKEYMTSQEFHFHAGPYLRILE
jgi:hypothetical protein